MRLLEKGRSLELTGRWADALSCYEEALREYPQDRTLQARFDVARLHYSLEQRYDDRSFRESLRTLRPQQALDQYSDLLDQDRHALLHRRRRGRTSARRGARAMDIALANEDFLRNHGIRVRGQQVEQLRAEIAQLPGRYAIRIVARRVGRRRANRPARQPAHRPERDGHAAGIHRRGGRRIGPLLGVPHRRSAPRHLLADRRQLCRPGRRAEGRQRRAVDRAT